MNFPVYGMPNVAWDANRPSNGMQPYDAVSERLEGNAALGDMTQIKAWVANAAPRMPWDRFITNVFRPKAGEHAGIIGATGQGKTHLQNSILPFWPFVVAFATKNNDDTMERLIRNGGYEKFSKWYALSARDHPRRVIWPQSRNLKEQTGVQRSVFEHAIENIWAEGGRPPSNPVGWAIAIDELWWFSNKLGMEEYIKVILLQGRSNGISLIAATQRPAWVPVEIYSQATHLFFFAENDARNLQRIGEINHRDKRGIRHIVSNLEEHQVLYVNTRTGQMVRTRAPKPQ
jgi:hypothetical protein